MFDLRQTEHIHSSHHDVFCKNKDSVRGFYDFILSNLRFQMNFDLNVMKSIYLLVFRITLGIKRHLESKVFF